MSIREAIFGEDKSIEDIEELQIKQEEMSQTFQFFLDQTESEISGLETKIQQLLRSGNPEQAMTLATIISELEDFQGLIRGNYGTILRSLYTARLAWYSNEIEQYVEETLETIQQEDLLDNEHQKELRKNVRKLRKKLENRKQQMATPKNNERAEAILERIAAESSEEASFLEEDIVEEEVATT